MTDEVRDLRLAFVRAVQAVREANRSQQAMLLNALRWLKASHAGVGDVKALIGRRGYLDESPDLGTPQRTEAWMDETEALAWALATPLRSDITMWVDELAASVSSCTEEEHAEAWALAVAELVMSD